MLFPGVIGRLGLGLGIFQPRQPLTADLDLPVQGRLVGITQLLLHGGHLVSQLPGRGGEGRYLVLGLGQGPVRVGQGLLPGGEELIQLVPSGRPAPHLGDLPRQRL